MIKIIKKVKQYFKELNEQLMTEVTIKIKKAKERNEFLKEYNLKLKENLEKYKRHEREKKSFDEYIELYPQEKRNKVLKELDDNYKAIKKETDSIMNYYETKLKDME